MNIQKKDLEKSQIEITIELSADEFAPYIEKGTEKLSAEIKVEGFRPGKVPFEILKQKVGEMSILEESARIAIAKTVDTAIDKEIGDRHPVGQPNISITKLAPGNALEYKVVLDLLPTIELGTYRDLKIKKDKVEVRDDEIQKMIDELAEMRAKEIIVDREIGMGDKAIVDISMSLSGVALENGIAKKTAVIIGKKYFVDGFDEKVIGAKKDAELSFPLDYPANHYDKTIAGKRVDFRVKVLEVYERQVPEINDKFAEQLGAKDLVELKKNLHENIEHEKEHEADHATEMKLFDKLIAGAKFGAIPESLIQNESEQMLSELKHNLEHQGVKLTDYLTHLKKSELELRLDLMPDAVKRIKIALLIRELGVKEKLVASAEDIEKRTEELKKQYAGNADVLGKVAEPSYRNYLANILTNQNVVAKLKEWNTIN